MDNKAMRIAYIGNFGPAYSTENDVRKAFEFLGHEVIKLQENEMTPGQVYNQAIKSDLLLITSTWDTALPLTDMINIFKGCVDEGVPTATLHLDTFWGKSRGGRQWWLNPMFHVGRIFTADGDYEDEWREFGKRHYWLPPAVRHDAVGKGTFREEYACDVAFVGSNGVGYHEDVWPYRRQLVDALREMCRRNGWSFKNPGGDHPKVERGTDLNDFYASAKVTVGDSLCLKRDASRYWSDRVPEATGRGAFLIMPHIDELEKIYDGTIGYYPWHNYAALEDCIRYWLVENNLRESCREAALEITKNNHTYVQRVQTILETVKEKK